MGDDRIEFTPRAVAFWGGALVAVLVGLALFFLNAPRTTPAITAVPEVSL